jgi:hypothetical protein
MLCSHTTPIETKHLLDLPNPGERLRPRLVGLEDIASDIVAREIVSECTVPQYIVTAAHLSSFRQLPAKLYSPKLAVIGLKISTSPDAEVNHIWLSWPT